MTSVKPIPREAVPKPFGTLSNDHWHPITDRKHLGTIEVLQAAIKASEDRNGK
jgi:hypothetical protein